MIDLQTLDVKLMVVLMNKFLALCKFFRELTFQISKQFEGLGSVIGGKCVCHWSHCTMTSSHAYDRAIPQTKSKWLTSYTEILKKRS